MIIDHISNYRRYLAVHPGFDSALGYLRELDAATRGTIEIAGTDIYAMINDIKPVGADQAKFEVHQQYIDIQYLIAGSDLIGWATAEPESPGTEYDRENDYRLVDVTAENWFTLRPGYFAIFFPEDAHAPLAGTEAMTKAVVKVKL